MRRRSPVQSTRTRLAAAGRLLACAIALGSLAIGCGSDERAEVAPAAVPGEATPAAPAAPVAPDPTTTEAGGIVVDGVVPEGFPSDVPLYPGAAPGASMTMPGLGVFATFESDDAIDKILSHYRGELSKGGWSVSDTPDGGGIDGTKDSRQVQVRARENETGRSEIAISFSES
jgi:hypothetical protein